MLRSNLLSVLYLTRQKEFIVTIRSNKLLFCRHRKLLFTATVNENNCGSLDGHTVPVSHFAHVSTTLPLDLSLWHRRLGHINYEYVQRMFRDSLVDRMKITSITRPDPICEPCLAGKQHPGPIPKTASFRAIKPLELVHIDLHGPMPVQTREGHCYWATFINEYCRVWTTVKLKAKGDLFNALQRYKAFAENLTGQKLLCL